MTYRELYLQGKKSLALTGIDSPGFDAAALAERFLGLDRPGLAVRGEETPAPQAAEEYLRAVEQRAEHRPLQYILGSWPFMGLQLSVGEGVLVPREDTAVLVETLASRLENPAPRGLDLCAGTGAVALGICSLIPGAAVTCVEVDPLAGRFLRENLDRYPQFRIEMIQGDILSPPAADIPGGLDFIAANPPYIPTDQLPGLQAEVCREPVLALDGGADGLDFYRAIAENWTPLLRPEGLLAVEIGETQAREAAEIFAAQGLWNIRVVQDLAGLDRVMIAEK